MNKKVSIIMPVYNAEKYLSDAIESILNQTYKNIEFIIINDGSMDESLNIISQYNDSRIVLIDNKENRGLPYSRNLGLEKATGEYICFMDSDDISYLNRIEKQIMFLEQNKHIDILSTGFDEIRDNMIIKTKGKDKISEKIRIELMFRCCIGNPTVMIRKNIIDKYNLVYRKECFVAQDYAFWVDCMKNCTFYHMKEALLAYRTGHDNITAISKKNKYWKRKQLIDTIRTRAVSNNGFLLDKKEIECFNRVFSDPVLDISIEDICSIKKILIKMVEQNSFNLYFNSRILCDTFKYLLVSRLIFDKNIQLNQKLKLISFKFKNESYKSVIMSSLRIIKTGI